ncbi:uncharacterized protein ANIA_11435 [Aspergillus nidulans FGSC A4]|uniref:Uncharacterized protein n=1 Tax=Emericella nidulans (strain FGSC A4 / ATCC 38163 / CBS 112.46 / NRRL 194 / M139) TaxID=227321 RepID=C8V939_EMENI|nr:hypothetical protein [Aspergillus nidulans FGSC A4]CBF77707.1 TPA: hypothetical protein ANIA_11435 [Aspergillus nidulans FGSC A4]
MRLMATAKSDGDWQQDTRRARGGAFLSPASRLSVVVVSGDAGQVWMERWIRGEPYNQHNTTYNGSVKRAAPSMD